MSKQLYNTIISLREELQEEIEVNQEINNDTFDNLRKAFPDYTGQRMLLDAISETQVMLCHAINKIAELDHKIVELYKECSRNNKHHSIVSSND